MTAKPPSIKGTGCKSAGRVRKAVELTSGDLLRIAESRLKESWRSFPGADTVRPERSLADIGDLMMEQFGRIKSPIKGEKEINRMAPSGNTLPREIARRQFLSLALASLGRAKPPRLIIDTHVEVWTIDPKFPFHHPEHPELKPTEEALTEDEVLEMREFGIKYAVLVNPRYYGWDNSYIRYSLHKYPSLFVAHGLLNPLGSDPASQLRYWIGEHGFQGMRFSPFYDPHSTWLNSKEDYPLWREAERLGAVFNFFILPHQMPMLEDMAGRFSGVKIVIDHLGMPDLKAADPWLDFRKMFRLKRFPQVWVKTHGNSQLSLTKSFPYRDTFPFFKATYEEFGPKQLLWGAGYVPKPGRKQAVNQALDFVDKIFDFYSPEDRDLILGRNALRIWKFPEG